MELSGKITLESQEYVLKRLIAKGGMASVYEAMQLGANGFEKTMALKIISDKFSGSEEFVGMFIGEAKLVADLIHQNIVQIYQLGHCEAGYFIAMEFIDGINLEQFSKKHAEQKMSVPSDLGAYIISRVSRGLEYAHSKRDRKTGELLGIVHRDVSPKNVMMDFEGSVKLADFGVAKASSYMANKEGEVLMGKVEYMSPEQARYEATDRRSDLFALGIVMYELLTGIQIFEDADIYVTLENVKWKEIPDPRTFNKDIPEDLAKILMRSLERDLAKRYQDAGQMAYDIEYYMYHDRYGHTYQSLGKYLRELFGRADTAQPGSRDWVSDRSANTIRWQKPGGK